jgi:hypothetical protein
MGMGFADSYYRVGEDRGVAGGRQLQGRRHGPRTGRVARNLPGPARI